MGLIQIIKDNYIIWHHGRILESIADGRKFKSQEYHSRLNEQYYKALTRERNRRFVYIEKTAY